MAKTRVVWDYEAAGDLMLRSSEIAGVCEAAAEKMTRAAGVDYVADVRMGRTRVNAGGRERADKAESLTGDREGKQVSGYWRKGKNGEKIWVKAYRRKK